MDKGKSTCANGQCGPAQTKCGPDKLCPVTPSGGFGCENTIIRNWCARKQQGPCDDEQALKQLEVVRDPFSLAATEPKYPDGKAQWSMGCKFQRSSEMKDINTAVVMLFPGATNWCVGFEVMTRTHERLATEAKVKEDVMVNLFNHNNNAYLQQKNYACIRNYITDVNYDTAMEAETFAEELEAGNENPTDRLRPFSVQWEVDQAQNLVSWRPVSAAMTIDCCGDSRDIDGYFETVRVPLDTFLTENFGIAYSRMDDPHEPTQDYDPGAAGLGDFIPSGDVSIFKRFTGSWSYNHRLNARAIVKAGLGVTTPTYETEAYEDGTDLGKWTHELENRIARRQEQTMAQRNGHSAYRAGNAIPFMKFLQHMSRDDWKWLRDNPSYSIQKCQNMGRYTFQLNHVKEENKFINYKTVSRFITEPKWHGYMTMNSPPLLGCIYGPCALSAIYGLENGRLEMPPTKDDPPRNDVPLFGYHDFNCEIEYHEHAWWRKGVNPERMDTMDTTCETQSEKKPRYTYLGPDMVVSAAPHDNSRLITLGTDKNPTNRKTVISKDQRMTDFQTGKTNHYEETFMAESMDVIIVVIRSKTANNRFVVRSCYNQEYLVSDASPYKNFLTKGYSLEKGIQAVKEERKRFHKQPYHYMTASGEKQVFYDEV